MIHCLGLIKVLLLFTVCAIVKVVAMTFLYHDIIVICVNSSYLNQGKLPKHFLKNLILILPFSNNSYSSIKINCTILTCLPSLKTALYG